MVHRKGKSFWLQANLIKISKDKRPSTRAQELLLARSCNMSAKKTSSLSSYIICHEGQEQHMQVLKFFFSYRHLILVVSRSQSYCLIVQTKKSSTKLFKTIFAFFCASQSIIVSPLQWWTIFLTTEDTIPFGRLTVLTTLGGPWTPCLVEFCRCFKSPLGPSEVKIKRG